MIFQRFITRFLKVVLLSLFANVASAADLLDIYQEARLQDSTYSAAKAEYIAAQEILPQSEALMMPDATFEIKSDWNRIDFDSTSSFQKDYGSHQAGVVITQPLLRTESDLAIEIAKSRVSKSDVQLAWVEQDLMLRTAYAYFDVLLKRTVRREFSNSV